MWDFCRTSEPLASKDYLCRAYEIIIGIGYGQEEYTREEWLAIQKAREEGGKILKGVKYICCTGMWEGEFSVFRARKDMDAICREYGYYEE